jgi:hypothetical protein
MSVCYSFTVIPELFFTDMPSISSRDMGTLATPMGPCDVSVFLFISSYFYFKYSLILTMHFFNFAYACSNLNCRRSPASWWRQGRNWLPATPPARRPRPKSARSQWRPLWRRPCPASPPCIWRRRPSSGRSGDVTSLRSILLTGLQLPKCG